MRMHKSKDYRSEQKKQNMKGKEERKKYALFY